MKAVVTGGNGLVARALVRSAPMQWQIVPLTRQQLDITDPQAVRAILAELEPDLVVNAAAYTACDQAEREPDAAIAVNTHGVSLLARACEELGARLVHLSTDYVFDGTGGRPYRPDDPTNPLNVYGRSKRDGESAALSLPGSLVVRTAWVHGAEGECFVQKILARLASGEAVPVIADQIGSPTHADSLARSLWALIERNAVGIYHVTDPGVASWYDLAVATAQICLEAGLLMEEPRIIPIRTEDYHQVARRPGFSVLDNTATWQELGECAPHWRVGLRSTVHDLKGARSSG